MGQQKPDHKQVTRIARAISRYLASRPDACDTVEGIAHWWLLRQRYEDALPRVAQALDFLVTTGEVTKLQGVGDVVMYRKRPAGDGSVLH